MGRRTHNPIIRPKNIISVEFGRCQSKLGFILNIGANGVYPEEMVELNGLVELPVIELPVLTVLGKDVLFDPKYAEFLEEVTKRSHWLSMGVSKGW